MKKRFNIFFCFLAAVVGAMACTSAVVTRGGSASGRTLLWKHRDTGARSNLIDSVAATDSTMAFIALFNTDDSLRREAWVGVNSAGFAVMNTASYNLAPDTTAFKDQEGVLMRRALEVCRTVADFDSLLTNWPQPKGIQANFGVTDANGVCSYFEADDHRVFRYPVDSLLAVRTNYSFAGGKERRYGEMRYRNACYLLDRIHRPLTPHDFLDGLSQSYYHDGKRRVLKGKEAAAASRKGEVIPRPSSRASVVIEGPGPDGSPARLYVMYGSPPRGDISVFTVPAR